MHYPKFYHSLIYITMKNLLKIGTALLLMVCFTLFSFKGDGEAFMQKKLEKALTVVKTEMNLSAEDYNQVETILTKYAGQLKDLHDQEGDRHDKREAFHTIMEAQKEELSQFLSEDQLDQLHEAIRPHRRGHRHGDWHGKMDKETRKQMKQEIKAYVQKNILPVAKQQRLQLDPAISTEDQAKIDELRALIAEHRSERKARRQECKGKEGKEGRENCRRGEGENRRGEHHRAMREHKEIAKKLAEKYDAQITPLIAPLQEQAPAWEEDVKAIVQKYVEADEMGERFFEKKFRKMTRLLAKPGFLVFDPNADWMDEEVNNDVVTERYMKVFPNPASNQTNLEYEVKEAGNVKVDLYNQNGDWIRTVFEGHQMAGTHNLSVDLRDLETMTYVYTVSDKSGQTSTRFVVK